MISICWVIKQKRRLNSVLLNLKIETCTFNYTGLESCKRKVSSLKTGKHSIIIWFIRQTAKNELLHELLFKKYPPQKTIMEDVNLYLRCLF